MPEAGMFAFEFRNLLNMPILAVGAAFSFPGGEAAASSSVDAGRRTGMAFPSAFRAEAFVAPVVYLNPAYLFLLALQGSASISIRDRRPATR